MLSIIIPTLNEEKYLPLLLESIKQQNFRDYEIIVADNNSCDRTIEIAKSYNCKIVKGGLPGEGRNAGAKIAKGDPILFLDADVVLPQNFLQNNLIEFEKRNLDVASCGVQILGKVRSIGYLGCFLYNLALLVFGKFLKWGTAFFLIKKDLHKKIGGFDEEIQLLEDVAYIRKASKLGKLGILRNAFIFWSPRRYEKKGWLRLGFKILSAYLHTIFIGPIKSDIFNYRFGHYDEE